MKLAPEIGQNPLKTGGLQGVTPIPCNVGCNIPAVKASVAQVGLGLTRQNSASG